MGDLAGKIIEGLLKEVVSGDFDVNKLLNMGVPVKTYTAAGRSTNPTMQRKYGVSGSTADDAKVEGNSGSGTGPAALVMSDAAPVIGADNSKAFATGKSQKSKNGKAASAGSFKSGTETQPAAADTDTAQSALREEKNGCEFKLSLDDQSLLNGFVLSEILGKPKYLRRGRW